MIKRVTQRTSATLPDTAKGGSGGSGAKEMELGEQIGRKLRAMFEDVAAEPVPERFRELLDELERSEPERKPGKP